MLLTGTFHRSLDEKFRFALPKPLRESLLQMGEKALFVTPGTDGSLTLYPESAFARLGDQLGDHSPAGQQVRTFSRLFYAQAQRVETDRQGRMRIPAELARLASLSREIVLLGVRDHLEIWEQTRWQAYLEQNQPRYDEIAENAFGSRPTQGSTDPGPPIVSGDEAAPPPARPR